MNFTKKRILALSFSSFVTLITVAFFSLGFCIGIIGGLISLFGGTGSFTLGEIVLSGPLATIPLFLTFTILFGLFGFIAGILIFLPFRFFLWINKGLDIEISEKNI